jgi:diaminopimelate epimerase
MRYARLHGLGNDYLVIREADLPFPLTPARIRAVCDRHTGVGSDGILLEVRSTREDADVGLRILNPDGSEAEKSGNGLRIFGHYLARRGRLEDRIVVDTLGGLAPIELLEDGRLRVGMGRATFAASEIPVAGEERLVLAEEVDVGGERLRITAVSVGNPHCVVFGSGWTEADLLRLGPLLERHPLFPHRTNVQLAERRAEDRIFIRVWERGAGHTLASGSSASAAAAAGVRLGLVRSPVVVEMEGGELAVEVDPATFSVVQSGPAEEVCEGWLSVEFMRRLETLG